VPFMARQILRIMKALKFIGPPKKAKDRKAAV
jgi:hypothetical protein